jgi:DNA repair protein RadD
MSPGLYYQMVGRGFRLHPSKENCLVLDFGGNVLRHGPVDDIKVTTIDRGDGKAPAKECPSCQAVIAAGFTTCPQCGYVFPPPERQQHDPKASEAGILSGQVSTTKLQVEDVYYGIHTKRGASEDAPRTLRVDYRVGWHEYKSEWVCFEHEGYARQKAVAWWRKRSPDPVPDSVERAIEIINGGGLATTIAIKVRSVAGDPYERIIDYELGPMPEGVPASEHSEFDPDEIPF